ncbi:DUF6414 family protein [Arthrobacter sp. QXT-31]|uniref:DUF6414 family protein n=1 Tax=Arthrobacter sp. QXT-31 TaxID=1357915 RepID=UPI0009717CF6|nr:hypothetical protein [Arthrobacter sp. QXT-31]APX00440.1 hypothetical protein BWQ92_00665 [Arthrobacter sp. QXT-31]
MKLMALRNPVYLDMETLAAQADYHEIRYPVPTEIVEKSTQGRSGEASAQIAGVGLRGKGGKDVELQKSFTLAPKDKAVVSRVLDSLIEEGHVRTETADGFSRDDLVELEGESFLHQGSLVGKLMHIALLAMQSEHVDLSNLNVAALEPEFLRHAKRAFLDNALLPIPLLLRLDRPVSEHDIYLDVEPGHFVGSRSITDIEGEIRVFGTVARLIDDGDFYTAERWLLPGWERQMRRLLMASPTLSEQVNAMSQVFDVGAVGDEKVEPFLRGPAIIISAIAVY